MSAGSAAAPDRRDWGAVWGAAESRASCKILQHTSQQPSGTPDSPSIPAAWFKVGTIIGLMLSLAKKWQAQPAKRKRANPAGCAPASSEDEDCEDAEYSLTVGLKDVEKADPAMASVNGFGATTAEAVQREQLVRSLYSTNGTQGRPESSLLRKIAVKLILDLGHELSRRSIVRIHSLVSHSSLNGRVGQLVLYDADEQRYAVKLYVAWGDPAICRRSLLIRGDNLRLLQPAAKEAMGLGLKMLPVQCLAVDILDRALLACSSQLDPPSSCNFSLRAKTLGRDSFVLALKSHGVAGSTLGLVGVDDFGDSALSPAELGLMKSKMRGKSAPRHDSESEFLLFSVRAPVCCSLLGRGNMLHPTVVYR